MNEKAIPMRFLLIAVSILALSCGSNQPPRDAHRFALHGVELYTQRDAVVQKVGEPKSVQHVGDRRRDTYDFGTFEYQNEMVSAIEAPSIEVDGKAIPVTENFTEIRAVLGPGNSPFPRNYAYPIPGVGAELVGFGGRPDFILRSAPKTQ